MAESKISVLARLSDWLRSPVIEVRISPADELASLRDKVNSLELENLKLQTLYGQECNLNMRLQDILKDNGIDWR